MRALVKYYKYGLGGGAYKLPLLLCCMLSVFLLTLSYYKMITPEVEAPGKHHLFHIHQAVAQSEISILLKESSLPSRQWAPRFNLTPKLQKEYQVQEALQINTTIQKDDRHSEELEDNLIKKVLNATKAIAKSQLLDSRSERDPLLEDAFSQLAGVLANLGYKNELENFQQSLLPAPHKVKNLDVCQEQYLKKDSSETDLRFRLYRDIGFYQENCTDVPPFHSLLTLVYNFVHYDSKYHSYIPELLHEAKNLYTNLPILAAIPENFSINDKDFRKTTFIRMNASMAEPDIWNSLVTKVKTKYVYIGRNVIKFTWHDRLERLVREINNLEASVVASSYRTLQSGVWSNGCEQSKLYNYILEYRSGYKISKEECLVCHHVHGPFVTLTALAQENPFTLQSSLTSSMADWFLKLKKQAKMVVSCPDAMAFVFDESQVKTTKNDWKELAFSLQIESIYLSDNQVIEFNCEEANAKCTGEFRPKGMLVSRCCRNELSQAIQFVMQMCRDNNVVCVLNAGTLLGAVKFNNVIPWEAIDADIFLHQNNITAFIQMRHAITERGYSLWENSYGYYGIGTKNGWTVEIYADNFEMPNSAEVTPTLVEFDYHLAETPLNPGLFARNSYGSEIYQHAQHWRHMTDNWSNLWEYFSNAKKQFSKCPHPGHHACLDEFTADGNIQFEEGPASNS